MCFCKNIFELNFNKIVNKSWKSIWNAYNIYVTDVSCRKHLIAFGSNSWFSGSIKFWKALRIGPGQMDLFWGFGLAGCHVSQLK